MLKIGKIPENVLKRSIIKQIKTKREEILIGAEAGEDCAIIELGPDEVFVTSTDPVIGTAPDICDLSINGAANDIASSGAEVVGVMLSVLLPEGTEEKDIKEMMQQVESVCSSLNIQAIGGHTEITNAVSRPIITVTGIGKVKKDKIITSSGAKVGDDVVVTKWIALEGTSIIAKEKEEMLLNRFAPSFVDTAKSFSNYLSVIPEAAVAENLGATAMHDVTKGGIFGALWEVAQASKVGLSIDLKAIPIKQETIEVCEVFGLNPYELTSGGSMLITVPNGYDLVRELKNAGISAAVIGKVTEGNDRLLINEDEKRFLEPPKSDELYKIYS